VIKIYIGLHIKCPLFLSNLNVNWIFTTDFGKNSNIKFHENLSSLLPNNCIRTDRHDKAIIQSSHFFGGGGGGGNSPTVRN